jgi:hypothetical protein
MMARRNIFKDVARMKSQLIEKAKKKGIYENFGQKEVRKLKDKYPEYNEYDETGRIIRNQIDNFDDWAMNFDQRKLSQLKEVV